jgi:hypothetical protein
MRTMTNDSAADAKSGSQVLAIVSKWTMSSEVSLWIVLPALLLTLTALSLARVYAGLFGLAFSTHDVFSLLDPAWRVLQGQRPYLDFYSQLAPLTYLQTALGLILSRGGAEGVVYGQVILGFVAAIWTFFLARARLPLTLACLLSVFVFLLAIGPMNYGEAFYRLSPAMTYNRTGYALLVILLIEALAPPRKGDRSGWAGGVSTGLVLGILLLTKITYFVGGAFLFGLLLGFRGRAKARLVAAATALCLVTLAFGAYVRFDIPAIVRDFRLMTAAKQLGPDKVLISALDLLSAEGSTYCLFIAFSVLILRKRGETRSARNVAVAGVAVLLTGSFLLFSNCQDWGLPLNVALAFVVAGQLLHGSHLESLSEQKLRWGLIAWAVLLALGPMASDATGIAFAAYQHKAGKIPPMKSPGLWALRTHETSYAEFVDDGLALANRYRRPTDTLMSLDFSDFFSYALRIKPPVGGATCLHYRNTFNDRAHLSPERLFGSADVVMMPVAFSESGSQESILRIYGPFLASHYHLDGESPKWRFYRRNID